MTFLQTVLSVGVLVGTAHPGDCRATRSWQVSDDARMTDGAFSPADGSIAYVRYGQKHFTDAGSFAFDVIVGFRKADQSRDLIHIPPRRTKSGWLLTERIQVRWLPSGRYLLAHPERDVVRGAWLAETAGALRTRAGAYGDWFVTNDEVSLCQRDSLALNGILHAFTVDREFYPRWLWDGIGAQPWLTDWPYRDHQSVYSAGCRRREGVGGTVTFAAMTSACIPASSLWPLDRPQHIAAQSYRPKLWFVDHDMAAHRASPDGKHVIYAGRADGQPDRHPQVPRQLWVKRSDGGSRRRLAEKVGWIHHWLDNEWVVYYTDRLTNSSAQQQIGIVNIHSLRGQLLTKGPFHHTLCDSRSGRFLVAEEPAQEGDEQAHRTYTSRLYIIEPLRVRM